MKRFIRQYIIQNSVSLIVLITALLLGLVLGCCCFETIGNEEELREFLGSIFTTLSRPETISLGELFQKSVLQIAFLSGLLFVSGLSLFGIGIIPFLVWYKGFASGFTMMVFFRLYGVRGIPFVALGILPSAVIWIPMLLMGALEACKTSFYLLECCCRNRNRQRFRQVFFHLCTVMSFSTMGLLLSGMVDVYLVPKLLGLISNLYG